MNDRQKCLLINNQIPKMGLHTGEKREIHSDSNVTWRISPEPFYLDHETIAWLDQLGTHLLKFYKACNLLYSQSVRQIQPSWIAEYLDQGKSETVISYGRMRRFKSKIPQVIRPDLLPTDRGMIVTELDSIPGGIGSTGNLAKIYAKLGHQIIGSSCGMIAGFAKMIRSQTDVTDPILAIVVSDESEDYRSEMSWLAEILREIGLESYTVHPRDLIFTEDGLLLQTENELKQIDVIYRFFELFDLKNIPKSELIFYSAKKRTVVMTPPPKAFLEEKMTFALFHHPTLIRFWRRELGKKTFDLLKQIIPKTWLIDPRPVPPHATIPNLEIDDEPITDFRQLAEISQKQRELVIKPSGFSELAWGGKGVAIGHDLSSNDWKSAIENALTSFDQTPHILQKFHKSKRVKLSYYDFDRDAIVSMWGRALLRPYYFVTGDQICLGGVQATVCPDDKKILHGMVDSIIVPCAAMTNETANKRE